MRVCVRATPARPTSFVSCTHPPHTIPPPTHHQDELLKLKHASLAEVNIAAALAARSAGVRLTKDTPFICDVRFTATPPPPPGDPKPIKRKLDVGGASAYAPSSLERGPLKDAPLGGGGVAVSLLTPEAYVAPSAPPRLHPADAALLRAAAGGGGGAGAAAAAAVAAGAPAAAGRPHGAELSWLVRTTYVTTDGARRGGAGGGGGQPAPSARGDGAAAAALAADPAALAAAVAATFDAASLPPVHPTNPTATPVSVRPLLPNPGAAAAAHHVLLTTDRDPLADAGGTIGRALTRLLPASRDALAAAAATKSYVVAREGGGDPDRFVAFLVPRPGSAAADAAIAAAARAADGAGPSTTPIVGEYEWVREFGYSVTAPPPPGAGAAAAVLDVGGAPSAPVTYIDVSTRLALTARRPRGEGGAAGTASGVARPEAVTLSSRPRTDAEEEDARARVRALGGTA